MEYTKSLDKNGEIFESYEGTPEEIYRLIELMKKIDKKSYINSGLIHSSPIASPNITVNTRGPNTRGPCFEDINKKAVEQINKAFKTMKANSTP